MMRDHLEPAVIEAFAGFRHSSLLAHKSSPGLADPTDTGQLAHSMATSIYQGMVSADDELYPRPTIARCAGILVYAMDGYGMDYEDVCNVADHAVAQVLICITPDNRLPAPRRHLAQRSAIGQCDEFPQLVKLSEIISAANGIIRSSSEADYKLHAHFLKDWVDKQMHLIAAMRALESRNRMKAQFTSARRLLAAIAAHSDETKKPKQAVEAAIVDVHANGVPKEGRIAMSA